jgi:antitoxin component YwqK of YwqJK toxin-antitoxin module/Flp pilus assembly protein TadD
MLRPVFFTLMVFFFRAGLPLPAQERPLPLINSRDVIEEGIRLYDDGRYDQAIAKYKTISRNDTNYIEALAELALAYIADKQNRQAVDVCHEALKVPSAFQFNLYNSLGTALDEMNRSDEAIAAYKEGIKKFPYKYLLPFNLAVTYLKGEQRDSALVYLQRAITLNPYHASSHLRLGMLYLEQGRVIPAMLALSFFLGLEPNSERGNNVILLLNKVAAGEYEFDKSKLVDPAAFKDDDFSEVDALFHSQVSLSAKYKSSTRLNFPVTKQMQLILEKLKYNAGDKGFCMQTYVPFFLQMNKDKQYPVFAYWSLASVNMKEITKWFRKNKSKVNDFVEWERKQINAMRETREEFLNGKKQVVQHFYYTDHNLQGIGNMKNYEKTIGDWEFYSSQGVLSSKGTFNDNGERTGEWRWYHEDGSLSEISHFKIGMRDGLAETFYPTGVRSAAYTYVNDKLNGETREYYSTGILKSVTLYTDGKKNGKATYYHPNGEKMYEVAYKDDELDGTFTQWYENGKLYTELTFVNGKKEGPAKYLLESGKPEQEGAYKDNNQAGPWVMYFEDGSRRSEMTFNDKGQLTGIYRSWYRNGKPHEEVSYSADGKLNGPMKEFAHDGTLITTIEYRDDVIQSYKCFDKSGKVIVDAGKPGKKLPYSARYQNGNLRVEGDYINGKKEGVWTYYDVYGNLKSKNTFREDRQDGPYTEYYDNGMVNIEMTYKEGQADGYYKSYFKNGKLRSEGWYRDGEQEGDWYFYSANGRLSTHNYFIHSTAYGWQEYYYDDGSKEKELWYQYGYVNKGQHYDSLGNITDRIDLPNGTGDYILKFPGGKPRLKLTYRNGLLQGKATWYYPDGSISQEGNYQDDKKEGTWKAWQPDGKPEYEVNYLHDEFSGTCKWYHDNGNLATENNYYSGMLDGRRRTWHDNKQQERESMFEEDLAQGEFTYYSPDGQLMSKRTFDEDVMVSYQYLDRDGKLVEGPKLDNETGKMTCYFQNGNKSFEQELKTGNIQGHRLEYYSSGTLYRDELYTDGKRQGLSKVMYPNGSVKSEENFLLDEEDGPARYYYDNGKVEMEGNYVLGDKHGKWNYYDKNGKLVAVRTYIFGVLYDDKKQ